MLSIFNIAAILLTLSALFGWLNRRFFDLTQAIGMLLFGLAAALLIAGVQVVFPEATFYQPLIRRCGRSTLPMSSSTECWDSCSSPAP